MFEVLSSNPQEIFDRHSNSKEGDWIYPRDTDCRYLDPFPHIANIDPEVVILPFLVVLFTIELRMVAARDSAVYSVEVALEGTAGQHIQQVQSEIKEMLICQDIDIESQRDQIRRLFDAIHLQNPSMLPALIHPLPLFEQAKPTRCTRGHPSEVLKLLVDCFVPFRHVPGAIEMLKDRFGSFPVYN